MTSVKFKGQQVELVGALPKVGSKAPDFTLVRGDLSECRLSDYKGKSLILSVFVSLDTAVCAKSVKTFDQKADGLVILNISKDLPFAQSRFCKTESIAKVETVSAFRSSFGKDYGLEIATGPLKGLLGRAIIAVDANGTVVYTELVEEITTEPNYEAAISSLRASKR